MGYGSRLRQVRMAHEITSQEDFGKILRAARPGGLSVNQVGRIEREEQPIPHDILAWLATEWGVDLNWLLTGTAASTGGCPVQEMSPPETEDEAEILEAEDVDHLRPEVRREFVPVVGKAAGGEALLATDGEYPVGAADRFVRAPGAGPRAFAVEVRGRSMAPEIEDGGLVLVGEPVEPPRRWRLAVVVYEEKPGLAYTVKTCRVEGPELVMRPVNPDYAVDRVRLEQVRRVLPVLSVLTHGR